jgi:hypothetical protein
MPTTDVGLGLHVAELPTEGLAAGCAVVFTWRDANGAWRGVDYTVEVAA